MKRTPSHSPAAWGSHPQRSHGELCLYLHFPHPPKLGGLPPGLRLSIVRLSDALTSLRSDALNITQPSVPTGYSQNPRRDFYFASRTVHFVRSAHRPCGPRRSPLLPRVFGSAARYRRNVFARRHQVYGALGSGTRLLAPESHELWPTRAIPHVRLVAYSAQQTRPRAAMRHARHPAQAADHGEPPPDHRHRGE